MKRRRLLQLLGLATAAGVASGHPPGPARADTVCNGDTCLDPRLAAAYDAHEGATYLGLPITTGLRTDARVRQYFEKGALQIDLLGGHVTLLDTGRMITQHRLPFSQIEAPRGNEHLYFPETGYSVSFALRIFYERHNGRERFGAPISAAFDDGFAGGPIVQYFARARLEWHPELQSVPDEVQLGDIGYELLRLDQNAAVLPRPAPLAFGMQVHTWHNSDPQLVTWRAAIAGAGWVKHQVKWSDVEPTETAIDWSQLDAFVAAAEQFELKILVSVLEAPSWTRAAGGVAGRPDDLGKFEHFMLLIAERYRGRVHAYEIWNEPNLALFWGRDVDYAEYAELLMAGHRGVKSGDPFALVLFAGLAQNGAGDAAHGINDVEFLRGVYAYKDGIVRNFFDIMGNHSYGYRSSPWAEFDSRLQRSGIQYQDHPSFYFKRFRQLRRVMEEYGDGARPMWLTEFGWTTANQHIDFPFGDLISEELQARYTVEAYRMVESEFPYIQNMFLFNLNFRTLGRPDTSEHGFGVLAPDFTPRPAFTSIQILGKSTISPGRR